MIEVKHVTKCYGKFKAVDDVSLTALGGKITVLLGPNGAGKSTLMNVLTGVFPRDKGEIEFDGKELKNITIKQSENLGIAFVHQELNLFNDLKVYENIFLQKEYTTKFGCLDKKKMIQEAERLFQELGVDIDPTQQVSKLKTSQKQLLEISKALFFKAKLLILDEPTTSLNNDEVAHLFDIVNNLKKKETSFIFISHKMPEIFRLSDRYTVFRNGEFIGAGNIKDTTPEDVTRMMVGEKYSDQDVYEKRSLGDIILELKDFSGEGFRNINLAVKKGSIVGLTGLQGAGSSELMQCMFGVTRAYSGEMRAMGKVMRDHSTIGLVITTDGSIGELPRSNYLGAEEKTILALKKSGKPFLVLVNSQKPYSEETRQVAEEIGKKYDVAVMPVNCEQLKKEDINRLLEKILYEFPLTAVEFYFPKWMDMLPVDHAVKQDLLRQIRELMNSYDRIRDVAGHPVELQGDYIQSCKMEPVQLWNGIVPVQVGIDDRYYYEMLSGMLGENVEDEYQLLNKLKELAEMKKEYTKVQDALSMVKIKGYGVVTPDREDIALEKPELIRHGNKFGVKIKASSPSIHMIRANIETEIAPIVGTEQQAQDLIHFIDQAEAEHGIWETNIFGKTVEQLVDDGITTKVASIGEESQLKLQDTMQKIVNDSNGGMVCIII